MGETMKFSKLISVLMLGMVVVLTSWGSMAHAAKFVIRYSHGMPEKMVSDQHAAAVVFKEMVEAGPKGEIEVRILGANTGGNERQQLDKVQTAINQMATGSKGTQHSSFRPARAPGRRSCRWRPARCGRSGRARGA